MVRKLSLWVRAHPIIGDTVIAALLFLFDVMVWRGDAFNRRISEPAFWSVTALLLAPLIVRRRNPIACAVTVALGGILQLVTHQLPGAAMVLIRPADLALCFALYTLGAYVGRKQALGYGAVLLLGTAAWALLSIHIGLNVVAVFCTGAVLLYAVFYIAAEYYGARRAYSAEVERRLALLETERDQETRIAVADERARIARELHDVVAHAVSVIVVQADGASYAVRANPDVAQQAINTISETGRTALAELRRLLGVLREESGDAELAPQPDASGLAELADQVGASGLPVRLRIAGDIDQLPDSVGRNLYRIIQEALTNTLKHGGPGASATVAVDSGTDGIDVRIEDDGTGEGALDEVSGGNGLVGMRERAAVHGGTVEAGPADGGGWRVHVRIPLQAE